MHGSVRYCYAKDGRTSESPLLSGRGLNSIVIVRTCMNPKISARRTIPLVPGQLAALWSRDGRPTLMAEEIAPCLDLVWKNLNIWNYRIGVKVKPDPELATWARGNYEQIHKTTALYRDYITSINTAIRPFNLQTAGVNAVFSGRRDAGGPAEFPGAFTKEGWLRFRAGIESPKTDPVLKNAENMSNSELRRLTDSYAEESIRQWSDFLAAIDLPRPMTT